MGQSVRKVALTPEVPLEADLEAFEGERPRATIPPGKLSTTCLLVRTGNFSASSTVLMEEGEIPAWSKLDL